MVEDVVADVDLILSEDGQRATGSTDDDVKKLANAGSKESTDPREDVTLRALHYGTTDITSFASSTSVETYNIEASVAKSWSNETRTAATGKQELSSENLLDVNHLTTTEQPIVIQNDEGEDIGVINKTTLLKGIQGGKA